MLLTDFIIFVLSLWVGFEVISKVPATLHTPLMSAANSIHGIVLAGGIVIAATAHNLVGYILAFVAVAFAAMNVVGGYVVTGRMLKMFKRRVAPVPAVARCRGEPERQGSLMSGTFNTVIQLIYLAAASCFVLGLHLMNNPATARRGNQVSVAGMVAAIVATGALVIHDGLINATGWIVIAAGILVGGGLGLYTARTVKMTAMPQLVSIFNAVGGGAAALVAIRDFMTIGGARRRLDVGADPA